MSRSIVEPTRWATTPAARNSNALTAACESRGARAADRPGVVYLTCAALAGLEVAVRSAHVDTLGPQAVDVFYLQEPSAGALGETRAAAAAHAVRSALSGGPR